MAKRAAGAILPNLQVVPGESGPLWVQIHRQLRSAILGARLPPGARLPSTRTLAHDLGVSRTSTESAFAQLEAEGFLARRVGAGTYVARVREALPARRKASRVGASGARATLSNRGRAMACARACDEPTEPRAFDAGLPALEAFPWRTWRRLLARRSRQSERDLMGYGDPAGHPALRDAVAAYVTTARGVACEPDQVVILTSSQQALDLSARLLLDPGDEVWLEDPGYLGARLAFEAAGARLCPVPVDDAGLDVGAGQSAALGARLAYVTPSHQYPTGVTMTLERRLALLAWAERAGAWVIEDDYDSEFRYHGRPIAAIQGLDRSARVIYVGTFTKVLFPSIRLAYAVVPRELKDAFVTARTLLDGHTAQLLQAVLADFMTEGHFGVHVRRMRALYGERRDALVEAADRELGKRLRLGPTDAGLEIAAYLPPGSKAREVAQRAARRGVSLVPLSRYAVAAAGPEGLLLGFAALTPAAIRAGMRTMARALSS